MHFVYILCITHFMKKPYTASWSLKLKKTWIDELMNEKQLQLALLNAALDKAFLNCLWENDAIGTSTL